MELGVLATISATLALPSVPVPTGQLIVFAVPSLPAQSGLTLVR